jgi:hypothetical protein
LFQIFRGNFQLHLAIARVQLFCSLYEPPEIALHCSALLHIKMKRKIVTVSSYRSTTVLEKAFNYEMLLNKINSETERLM